MTALEIVNKFYELNCEIPAGKGSIADLRALFADDLVFTGPMMRVEGGDQYAGLLQQFLPLHESLTLVRQFAEGDEVCSIVDLRVKSPAGNTMKMDLAEWIVVTNGKIASHTIFYDPREFAAAFPM